MISHAGTGLDTCVGDLHCPVQTPGTAGCKGIDHYHHIRFGLTYYTLDDLCGLHTGLGHYPGFNAADQVYSLSVVRSFAVSLYHMSCDKQIVHYLWPQSICCHLPVPQAHHQDGLFCITARYHILKFFGQAFRNLPVITIVRLHHGRGLHSHIDPYRLSHGFGSVLRINHHLCHTDVIFFPVILLHAHATKLTVCLRDTLPGLQRQIRSHLKITHLLLLLFLGGES